MSEAIKSMNVPVGVGPQLGLRRPRWVNYLPALLPVVGAAGLVTARVKLGAGAVPGDGGLVVLALLCYVMAAAMHVTDFWAPIKLLQRLALWTASLGFFFNLSGWLVQWVAAGDREDWVRMTSQVTGEYHAWWFFSYVPFANLYDLSVAFATLLIEHRPNARFVGALSPPLLALVLLLAVFIGNELRNLPPVLDSYWRPIHVGVASLSYGVALVSFAIAVMYLVKDGVKPELMGASVAAAVVSGFVLGSPSFAAGSLAYRLNPVSVSDQGLQVIKGSWVTIPGVGPWLTISLALLLVAAGCFALDVWKGHEPARRAGHLAARASVVTQGVALARLFYQLRAIEDPASLIETGQPSPLAEGARLMLSTRSNPLELILLVAALAATVFIALVGAGSERMRASLPALEKLDGLIYKTAGVAFAGLGVLLVTGAIWANESWGRYWGWDPKETGALVAWLAYAGYLHMRIAHEWSGRRGAYFVLAGFLLIIFTYVGVSYFLPSLHAYAEGWGVKS